MKYIIHNIWKGNAPPMGKGNPIWINQFCCHFDGGTMEKSVSAEQNSNRFLTAFGMTSTYGSLLLNMRDGPRGRAPANNLAMANGLVTLTQKNSVDLCGFSVTSVVKQKINHKERGEDTESTAVYALDSTKTFRDYCITKELGPAGGKLWKLRTARLGEIPTEASGAKGRIGD